MAVFKYAKCGCGFKNKEPRPGKEPPACPRCGDKMSYSENWYLSYQHHGKKYVQAGFPQKRDTETALGKIKAAIKEGRYFDKAPATPWSKAAKQFRAWCENNVLPNTQRMYANSIKNLTPYFEAYTIDKITVPMLEQFKAERSLCVKPATVNRDLAAIKKMFSLAEDGNLLEVNLIRRVKLLREDNARVRCLTGKEIDTLLKICREGFEDKKRKIKVRANSDLHLAVLIALNTGLRKEGVFGLKWSDVNFEQNMITRQVKGNKTVHIPLSKALREALLEHKGAKVVPLSPYILPSPRKAGSPLRDSRKAFTSALKGAGIKDFRFHDLRHTFATHFLRHTKDLKALQEILGHSDIKMTMRYAHVLKEHLTEAMSTFEQSAGLRGATSD